MFYKQSSNHNVVCFSFITRMCLPNDSIRSYLKAISDHCCRDTQMVVCILPNNRKDRYDAIKKLVCIDHPGLIIISFSPMIRSNDNHFGSVTNCIEFGSNRASSIGGAYGNEITYYSVE